MTTCKTETAQTGLRNRLSIGCLGTLIGVCIFVVRLVLIVAILALLGW